MANKLQEEVTCPICLEILQNPVTIDCGHNFCQQCIIQVGKTTENLQCPLCKVTVSKDTFRPNKQLASLAETIRSMDPTEFQPEGEEKRCLKHKEKFHYFCEQDGEFLCLVCRDSRSHKSHNVTLIDEADQNYKVGTWLLLYPQPSRGELPEDIGAAACASWLVLTAALELAICSQAQWAQRAKFWEMPVCNQGEKKKKNQNSALGAGEITRSVRHLPPSLRTQVWPSGPHSTREKIV